MKKTIVPLIASNSENAANIAINGRQGSVFNVLLTTSYREIFKRDGWLAPYMNHSHANRIRYPEQYSKEGLQRTSCRFWSSQEFQRVQREQREVWMDNEERRLQDDEERLEEDNSEDDSDEDSSCS